MFSPAVKLAILRISPMLALAISLFATSQGAARAQDPFGLGNADQFTVLDLSGQLSLNGPSHVVGDVGVVSGKINFASPATVDGALFTHSGVNGGNSGVSFSGGIVPQSAAVDALLNSAFTSANDRSQFYAGLAPTITGVGAVNISNPSQNLTLTGKSGLNVVDLSGLTLNNGTLTLAGPADAKFVINDHGAFSVNGGSGIVTAGGVLPGNVLYNVLGSGGDVAITGDRNSEIAGTILAPARTIAAHDKTVDGDLIGNNIALTSGVNVVGPPPGNSVVPEGGSAGLFAAGAMPLLALPLTKLRRRFRRK